MRGALAVSVWATCAVSAACAPQQAPPAWPTPQTPVSELIAYVEEQIEYQPTKCLAFVDQALVWHPGDAELFEQRARCLYLDRRAEEAYRAAEAAVAADPTRAGAHAIIGGYTERGNPKRAVVAYRAYLEHRLTDRADLDAYVRAHLGLALLRLDRVDEAIVELERVRDETPDARQEKRRSRQNQRAQKEAARGLCLAYALRDELRGLLICEQISAYTSIQLDDGTLSYSLARLFLLAGDHGRARFAAKQFARLRRQTVDAAVFDDPAALATWLRAQQSPIPR